MSLLTLGAVTVPFCFFSLGQLVNWLIQVQILLQFVWQCGAVILMRRYRTDVAKPFRMWLYPLPAIVSLAMWIYVFVSAPLAGIVFSAGFFAAAIAAFDFVVHGAPADAARVGSAADKHALEKLRSTEVRSDMRAEAVVVGLKLCEPGS